MLVNFTIHKQFNDTNILHIERINERIQHSTPSINVYEFLFFF